MINLPFMNTPKATVNTDVAPINERNVDLSRSGSHNFEHEVQNSEAELDQQTARQVKAIEKAPKQNEVKKESDNEELSAKSESVESDEQQSLEEEVNVQEMVAKEASSADVDLVSLNEVLSQLALNIQRTVEDHVDTTNTELDSSSESADDSQEVTVAELGMFEAAGIDMTQLPTHDSKQSNVKKQSNIQVLARDIKVSDEEKKQIDTDQDDDQAVILSKNARYEVEVKSEEEAVFTDEEAKEDGDNNSISFKGDDSLETSSNISNVSNLENFNFNFSGAAQDNVNFGLNALENAQARHVVALASKSLLESMEHTGNVNKVDHAFKEVTVQALQVKMQPTTSLAEMVDAKNVINQVLESMKSNVRQGSPQLQIRLDPPEWGSIHVKMNFSNNEVNVTLVAEQQQVKEALDKGVQALRGQFMQQGLNLGNVNIGVGNGAQNAEKDAREQLAEEEKRQLKKVGATPKGVAKRSGLIRGVDSVVDSLV